MKEEIQKLSTLIGHLRSNKPLNSFIIFEIDMLFNFLKDQLHSIAHKNNDLENNLKNALNELSLVKIGYEQVYRELHQQKIDSAENTNLQDQTVVLEEQVSQITEDKLNLQKALDDLLQEYQELYQDYSRLLNQSIQSEPLLENEISKIEEVLYNN